MAFSLCLHLWKSFEAHPAARDVAAEAIDLDAKESLDYHDELISCQVAIPL
jgi:hypothetical protein